MKYIVKRIPLNVFDENEGYVDREAMQALIQDQMAPEIFQAAIEQSSILSMARRLPDMTSRQTRLPVLDSMPMAYFLDADDAHKKTTKQAWKNKNIIAAEIAVIVPFSQAAADDADYDVVDQVTPRLGEAFGKAIDEAIAFGVGKPTFWPKGIYEQAVEAGATVESGANLYDDLLGTGGVISKVEESGYFADGHIAAISMRAALRSIKDNNGQPLFTRSMQQSNSYMLDGAPIYFPRNGAFYPNKARIISGDFNQLVYSIRQDLTIDIFTEGVIDDGNGKILYNLMQNDMFAIRAVMRLGWELPNPVNGIEGDASKRFPFAVLLPAGERADSLMAAPGAGPAVPVTYDDVMLDKMTIDQIKALASGLGYEINARNKGDIITEFLAEQAAATVG